MVLVLIGVCLTIILWKGVLPSVVVSYALDRTKRKVERNPVIEFLGQTFLNFDFEEFERRNARERGEEDGDAA